jgi:hypothetical protein
MLDVGASDRMSSWSRCVFSWLVMRRVAIVRFLDSMSRYVGRQVNAKRYTQRYGWVRRELSGDENDELVV